MERLAADYVGELADVLPGAASEKLTGPVSAERPGPDAVTLDAQRSAAEDSANGDAAGSSSGPVGLPRDEDGDRRRKPRGANPHVRSARSRGRRMVPYRSIWPAVLCQAALAALALAASTLLVWLLLN